MERFICIHGHFYQPPRENPWLETVELQDSAWPYHDWNERITAECYGPNATARILDGDKRILEISNNYSRISFNFGPTLLAWMLDRMPEIHEAIINADRISQERYSGHGSALAQVYNHMILPLANTRDKYTQVLWGLRDFQRRFGRQAEGMWLSETAADIATLETLAEQGVKFTILSPFQASRIRDLSKRNWRDVNGGQIAPSRAYLAKLPSGRSINLFFYDAPVSQAVAFEHLLNSGERFAQRLTNAFSDRWQWDQLVHIATDGESYGHHHRHGEMALAYALRWIEQHQAARLTVYAEYLEKFPPSHLVQIHEKSAWSCSHGVGRWMEDCGCNSGGHPGWNQGWRTPLRQALDWLRDELVPLFEGNAKEVLKDPWGARNEYISVILDRSPESIDKFITAHCTRPLKDDEKMRVLKLMELQRHSMLMYTSCGWFFDEVSGIESVQVVQYAARALQLASELFGRDLEEGFLERFENAKSNIAEQRDGRCIYKKFVKPAMIDWPKAVAHYAISSVFAQYAEKTRIFSLSFEDEHRHTASAGKARLAIGRTRVRSEITLESRLLTYAILYMGEHNLTGGVQDSGSMEAYDQMFKDITTAFESGDFPETIRLIDRHFGHASYSLKSLFKDEQRRILNEILASTREDLESRFRLITERYASLMNYLQTAGAPLPQALKTVADYVLHRDIRDHLKLDPIDFERLTNLFNEARVHAPHLLDTDIDFVVKTRMEELIEKLAANPMDVAQMRMLEKLAALVMPSSLNLNLWRVQNIYWSMVQRVLPELRDRAPTDEEANNWVNEFATLGERLGFATSNFRVSPPLAVAA